MALTPKRKTTERKLAANRLNARMSRGAVSDAGKARAAAANLRHGYYSKAAEVALTARARIRPSTSGASIRLLTPMRPPMPWKWAW
jgi:hypothetical protein